MPAVDGEPERRPVPGDPLAPVGAGQLRGLPAVLGEARQMPALALPVQSAVVERTAHRVGCRLAPDAPTRLRCTALEGDLRQPSGHLVGVRGSAVHVVRHPPYEDGQDARRIPGGRWHLEGGRRRPTPLVRSALVRHRHPVRAQRLTVKPRHQQPLRAGAVRKGHRLQVVRVRQAPPVPDVAVVEAVVVGEEDRPALRDRRDAVGAVAVGRLSSRSRRSPGLTRSSRYGAASRPARAAAPRPRRARGAVRAWPACRPAGCPWG